MVTEYTRRKERERRATLEEGKALIAGVTDAIARLQAWTAPEVEPYFERGDTGNYDTPALRCPHCLNEIVDDEVFELDYSLRENEGECDTEDESVTFSQEDAEHETLAYVHRPCGGPVAFPEGFDIDWY